MRPEARRIIEAARGGDDPDSAARARIRSALARKMGVGVAVATTALTTTTAAKASSTIAATTGIGSALFGKTILAIAIVSAVGSGSYAIARAHRAPKSEAPAIVATAASQPKAIALVPTATPQVVVVTPAPSASVEVSPKIVEKPKAIAKTSAPVGDDVAAEVAVLREAHAALQAGNPARAIAVLDATKASGSLAQERAGTRVIAVCALGGADGKDAAERFLAGNPSSPLAARIRSTCKVD